MPEGLVRNGDYRNGSPVTEPKDFGNKVTWTPKASEFGNPVDWAPSPAHFGNPVTWSPSPTHYGNQVGGTAATPTFDPPAGTYGVPQIVKIASAGNAAIFYTTDGTAPTSASTLYEGSVRVASSETIKAIAYSDGGTPSAVGTAAYVISNP
jgi:hypothetical protein